MKLQTKFSNKMKMQDNSKWKAPPGIRQVSLGENVYLFFSLILQCMCVPVLYIQLFSLVYGLRYKTVREVLTDTDNLWWK